MAPEAAAHCHAARQVSDAATPQAPHQPNLLLADRFRPWDGAARVLVDPSVEEVAMRDPLSSHRPLPLGLHLAVAEGQDRAVADTLIEMIHTLAFALELRDSARQVLGHSTRVAARASAIAARLGVASADRDTLLHATRLHEVGMISVPPELLLRPSSLTPEELAQVRDHARVGAEIARTTHPESVAFLIEHQYSDFRSLQDRPGTGAGELLLAGILRVADVIEAVSTPRPYQLPFNRKRVRELLEGGLGTSFHPLAVDAALRIYA